MRYFRSYQFLFDSPNWLVNLLIGIVCNLVPVAGAIVFLGYGYEIIEAKHRRGDAGYPDFDFNRLGQYFMRGVWPFLVQLLITIPLVMLVGVVYVVALMGSAVALQQKAGAVFALVLGLSLLFIMALVLVIQVAAIPSILRAGLSQDFGSAFSWEFFRDFLRRTWREMVLAALFIFGSSLVLSFAGLLLCCVGTYPAASWITFAQFHLTYQLYPHELSLSTSGQPMLLR